MKRGDLVTNNRNEFGIVLIVERSTAVIQYGNGLKIDQALEELYEVPIQPGMMAGASTPAPSPSNFIELLPVWPDTIPEDYRLRIQAIEKWVGAVNERYDDLNDRLNSLEVMRRLKGE